MPYLISSLSLLALLNTSFLYFLLTASLFFYLTFAFWSGKNLGPEHAWKCAREKARVKLRSPPTIPSKDFKKTHENVFFKNGNFKKAVRTSFQKYLHPPPALKPDPTHLMLFFSAWECARNEKSFCPAKKQIPLPYLKYTILWSGSRCWLSMKAYSVSEYCAHYPSYRGFLYLRCPYIVFDD